MTYAAVVAIATAGVLAAENHVFDLPADAAEICLSRFSMQSGVALVFPWEIVGGSRTQAVHGAFSRREAVDRLLANSGLITTENKQTGPIVFNVPPSARDAVPCGRVSLRVRIIIGRKQTLSLSP